MSQEEDRIKVRIGDGIRTIEIDAPVSSYDQAVEGARQLTEGWQSVAPQASATAPAASVAEPPTLASRKESARSKPSKPGTSAGRPGRIGSFEPQRDLINEEQQIAIRQFMQGKRPVDQSDQVIVAMYQGEELLGRQGFSFNDIYTLMWRAGVDPLPKALDVVVQRLMQDQRVERGENGYFLKFLGRVRVENELPMAAKDVV